MKYLLRIEEFAQFVIAIVALYIQPISLPWWAWPIVFLGPDISMAGYAVNNQIGAICYNFFHHKAVAIAVILAGYFANVPILLLAGVVLYAHSSMDRIFGYGLKYFTGFRHTHLGDLSLNNGARS